MIQHRNEYPSKGVALVTGAARGIGLSFAHTLVQQGIVCALLDIAADALRSAVADFSPAAKERVVPVICDITSITEVETAINDIIEHFGRIDILVNNAGVIFDKRQPIESLDIQTWKHSLEVNVTGTFLVCRTVLPHMRRNSYGRIVNITSALVNTGAPGRVHYVAAKAAIIGFTRALAREVGADGITVNALAPGLTDSGPQAREFVPGEIFAFEEQRRCIPGRIYPDDLASALLFLVDRNSSFITGQTITVDGGAVMR